MSAGIEEMHRGKPDIPASPYVIGRFSMIGVDDTWIGQEG